MKINCLFHFCLLPSNNSLMTVVITKTLRINFFLRSNKWNRNEKKCNVWSHGLSFTWCVGDLVLNFKANHIYFTSSKCIRIFFLFVPMKYQISGNYFKLNLQFDQAKGFSLHFERNVYKCVQNYNVLLQNALHSHIVFCFDNSMKRRETGPKPLQWRWKQNGK